MYIIYVCVRMARSSDTVWYYSTDRYTYRHELFKLAIIAPQCAILTGPDYAHTHKKGRRPIIIWFRRRYKCFYLLAFSVKAWTSGYQFRAALPCQCLCGTIHMCKYFHTFHIFVNEPNQARLRIKIENLAPRERRNLIFGQTATVTPKSDTTRWRGIATPRGETTRRFGGDATRWRQVQQNQRRRRRRLDCGDASDAKP